MAYGLGRAIRTFGKAVKPVAEGVGGAIGKTVDDIPVGHRLIGNKVMMPSAAYQNQVIKASTAAKTSSTSMGNPVFVGNRHPGLSPGVEDFTGLEVPEEALAWFEGGGRSEFLNNTFLNVGTKKNPKYITFEELLKKWQSAEPGSNLEKALKKKVDGYKSGLATPWAKDANDIIRYQEKGRPLAITNELKETNPELFSPQIDRSLEFHHKSMKAIEYEIFKKMDELIASGDATVIDLINLHNLGKQYGIEAGSRAGASVDMHRGPHNWMHKDRMGPLRIEPSQNPEAFGGLKTPLAKMQKPPKIFGKISDIDWRKVKASGASTVDDLEYIKNWADTVGYTKAIKKWKAAKAKGKIYVSDGKSEIERLVEEIQTIKNPADLTQFRKDFLENVSKPMTDEAELLERAIARNPNPKFIHETAKWKKKGLGPELEKMRFEQKQFEYNEALKGDGPIPENPEYEQLIGDFI